MTETARSYGFVLREAPRIIGLYSKAKEKGVSFNQGYLNAASQCADRSRQFVIGYSEKQVPKGTVTRTFGSSCAGIVTLLVHTHSFASNAVLNQLEHDKRFCHANTFNMLQQLVAITLETTGQGRTIFPDTGHSMIATVRQLAIEVPKFRAISESAEIAYSQPIRCARPLLSLPTKANRLGRS